MRKIRRITVSLMFAGVVSFGFWACSQDEGIETSQTTEDIESNSIKSTSSNKPVIEDEGDRLFSEYVSSVEFATYYNAIEEFNTNLNNRKTISDFESDEEMFTWIGNNISATRFTKVDNAIIDWNEIGSLSVQLETKFPKVTDFYRTKSKLIVGEKIDKWFVWGMGLDFTTTLGSCADDLIGCRKSASDAYAESAHELVALADEGQDMEVIRKKNIAMSTYQEAIKSCIEQYHNCNGTNN